MNPRQIEELIKAQPFQPLCFKFSDGTEEIVTHPDNLILAATAIGIGQRDDSPDARFPDWVKTYALVHLVSVEPAHPQSA